jgi:hypothetical protein
VVGPFFYAGRSFVFAFCFILGLFLSLDLFVSFIYSFFMIRASLGPSGAGSPPELIYLCPFGQIYLLFLRFCLNRVFNFRMFDSSFDFIYLESFHF